jgi:hypothetical protein
MQVREEIDDPAIGLLREGIVPIGRAEPRLNMGDRDSLIEGGERGAQGGRRVSLHHNVGRPLGFEYRGDLDDHVCGHTRQRLVRGHQVEIVVGDEIEQSKDRLDHLAVLSRDAETCLHVSDAGP